MAVKLFLGRRRVRKKPLRFVARPKPGVWEDIHRVAERRHARMARIYLDAVKLAQEQLSEDRLTRALEVTNPIDAIDQVLDTYLISAALEPAAIELEREIMEAAAKAALPTIPGLVGKQTATSTPPTPPGFVVSAFFDLTNPEAIRQAALLGAAMVKNVTDNMLAALRAVVLEAQERGVSVRDQARLIARELNRDVGLTRPQIKSLRLLQTTWEAAGFSDGRVADLLRDARDRMIRQRSLMIARTETLTAANAGVNELWRQAQMEDLLPTDVKREWVTQSPLNERNPCPICRPMDGQKRPMGEAFVSPYNGATAVMPPIHTQCVCVLVLDLETEGEMN